MNEYLIYKVLSVAVGVSIYVWKKVKNKKEDVVYVEPSELENGDFAIPKPEDEFMEGIKYDEIKTNINVKETKAVTSRLPDPKGTPTVRP